MPADEDVLTPAQRAALAYQGARAETWQHIKQLWHVLVRFGRPASS